MAKMVLKMANICENRKNNDKDTASNHGPEDYVEFYRLSII